MSNYRYPLFLAFLVVGAVPPGGEYVRSVASAAEETPTDVLAAQIRNQGVVCDKPRSATRDAKRSKPDHEVWVLQCENATYRISRYPDMAAKVEQLRQHR
jgi:hypothetical protein